MEISFVQIPRTTHERRFFMPDVPTEAREIIRLWLARELDRHGWKPAQLAKQAKTSASTVYRALEDGGTFTPNARTLKKFADALGSAMPPGFATGFAETEAEPFRYDAGEDFNSFIKAYVSGRTGVDPWVLRTRALDLLGYLPGDVVILDLNAAWRPKDIVCAQWWRPGAGSRTETIWRQYEPPYLVSISSDRSIQRLIHEDAVDQKGAVIASFRPRAG